MRLDFKAIDQRIELFVDYFVASSSSDPKRDFLTLQSKCRDFDNRPEERLYYIFLATHFDSPNLATDFHQKMGWKEVQHNSKSNIRKICVDYFRGKKFSGKYSIGAHRKFFNCFRTEKKVDFTVELFVSYKKAIEKHDSQVDFFEINNGQAKFDALYRKMKEETTGFHTRLSRFDHLERLSRIHNFYVAPERFYVEESSGPLYGLTYLLFCKRLGKDNGIKKVDLTNKTFFTKWNKQIAGKNPIPAGSSFKEIMRYLEQWLIASILGWKSLPTSKRDDKAFMFDLESCLCNWQKKVNKRDINGSC